MKISDVSLRLGEREEALAGYRRALAIRETLVAANPDSAEGRAQLARIHERLGAYYQAVAGSGRRAEDWREAKRWYQLSLDTFEQLRQGNKLAADHAGQPAELAKRIRACDAALGSD